MDTCENSLWVNGTFAVTYVVAMAVTFYDNRNRQQSDKVIRMVTWIVPGMTLLYNGIARWIDMGVRKENLLMAILYVGMGLLFVIVGNYLPTITNSNPIPTYKIAMSRFSFLTPISIHLAIPL